MCIRTQFYCFIKTAVAASALHSSLYFSRVSRELSLLLLRCIRGCGKYYPKHSSENPIIAYHLGTFGMLFPMYYDLGHANSNLDCNLEWIACKLGCRHWVECNLGTLVYSEYNCNRVWMTQRQHKVCETCEICLFMRLRQNSVWKYMRMCLFFFVYVCVPVESIVGCREMFSDSVWISSRSWQLLLMGFESHWVYSQHSLLAWTHTHSHTNINTRHI